MGRYPKAHASWLHVLKLGHFRYRLCIYLVVVLTLMFLLFNAIYYHGAVPGIISTVRADKTKVVLQKSEILEMHRNKPFLQNNAVNVEEYQSFLPETPLLGPVGSGGEYADEEARSKVPEDLRVKLRNKFGIDPTEDHVFKSPYLITPNVYPKAKVQSDTDGVKTKILSMFNPQKWFREIISNKKFIRCPYYKCEIDMDGEKLQEADLVMFFVGQLERLNPPPRPKGQLWVKTYWESPANYDYPKNYDPWRSVFNLTFNYRLDSDIYAPINNLGWRHRGELLSDAEYLQIAKKKSKPVAWFVSNCHTNSRREDYVKEFQKYVPVDIYGNCGTMKCTRQNMLQCKQLLNTTYYFYLSFENSLCRDYITEKFFRNFESRTHIVPVVRGGVDYSSKFPSESFVDARKFPTVRDLAMYLKELMVDPQRYARMLREKDRLVTLGYKHDWCDLCQRLHTTGFPPKTIPDIREWSHSNACHEPDDLGVR